MTRDKTERMLESWLRQLKEENPDTWWALWRTVGAIVEGKKQQRAKARKTKRAA